MSVNVLCVNDGDSLRRALLFILPHRGQRLEAQEARLRGTVDRSAEEAARREDALLLRRETVTTGTRSVDTLVARLQQLQTVVDTLQRARQEETRKQIGT